MRNFFVGRVIGMNDTNNGYMVEVFTGGQFVVYGPMHYIADPRSNTAGETGYERSGGNARTVPPVVNGEAVKPVTAPDIYSVGDKVLIANFLYRDQFVILGNYMDINPVAEEIAVIDPDGDGTITLVEETI